MRILITVLILSALVGGMALSVTERDARSQTDAALSHTADSMQVYRNAVTEFATANPTVTGPVDQADLNLPVWFSPPVELRNYVVAGDSFVYVVTQTAGAAAKLFEDSPQSALVGSARDGLLFSPVDGFTAMSLPSGIPEGAVVYAAPKAAAVVASCGTAPDVSESQAGVCAAGTFGAFTQTRSATFDPAGSPICWQQTGWTPWSPATAPVGACTPCPADESQTQAGTCPAGEFGGLTQARTRSFDCAAGVWNAWGAWNTTASTCAPCPAAPQIDTRSSSCPAGQFGAIAEQRSRSFDCGAGAWGSWGAWTTTANTCSPCPTPQSQTQTVACPAGQFGTATQERTRGFDCAGGAWNAWGAWATTISTCAPCPAAPEIETRAVACPVGQSGAVNQQRARSFNCGAGAWDAWSAWSNVSNTCVACPSPETDVRSVGCPAGQFGAVGEQRTRSFDCPGGAWNAWGAWATSSNTCAACPGATVETQTQWVPSSAGCAGGQHGSSTWERQQTRTRTVSYSCPAGTLTAPAPIFGAWSGWSDTGSTRNSVSTCTACPGASTETDQRWDPRNIGCPANTTGTYTWEMRQSRSRSQSFACPAGTPTLPAPTFGAWSGWFDDNVTRNTVFTCASNCVVPSPSTESDARWNAASGNCPAGQFGAQWWEAQETRSRTAFCPAVTGSFAWGSWTGWAATGATRNFGSSCTNCPGQESRWIPYTAANCPAGQFGLQNWQFAEVRNASCPAGSTAPSWGGWAWNGMSGVFVNNGTCANCPAPTNESRTQWVASSAACPAGQSGSHTWEREQVSTRTISYSCPAGSTSIPAPTTGAWGGWANTGATRSVVNTCVPAGCAGVLRWSVTWQSDTVPFGTCASFNLGQAVPNGSACSVEGATRMWRQCQTSAAYRDFDASCVCN